MTPLPPHRRLQPLVMLAALGCGRTGLEPPRQVGGPMIADAGPSSTGDLGAPGCGALAVTPARFDFGSLTTATSSAMAPLAVTNRGPGPVPGITVSLDSPVFTVRDDSCVGALGPGDQCSISVVFRPDHPGAHAAQLTVVATGPCLDRAEASLTGLAVAREAHLTITPASGDLREATLGCSGPLGVFTVTNDGDLPSGPLATSVTAPFELEGPPCSGAPLAGGAFCRIAVALVPTTVGPLAGGLSAVAMPGGQVRAGLRGLGRTIEETVSLLPTSHEFGPVPAGQRSETERFVLTNGGDVPLGPYQASVNSAPFVVLDSDCAAMVAPGASCAMEVVFAPVDPGLRAASLSVKGPPCAGAFLARLSGTGL